MKTELAETLSGLASRINDEHHKCEESARATLEHAMDAGELLLQAKKANGHRGWTKWLEDNFDGAIRTAQRYMLIARNRECLEMEETTCVSFLSTSGALRLIQEKKRGEKRCDPFTPPPEFKPPSGNGRVLKIYRHEEERGWEVAYGPNQVGLGLKELLEEAEQRTEFDNIREQAVECAEEAERLRADGQRLIDEADKWSQLSKELKEDIRSSAHAAVELQHGTPYPQIDSFEFFVLDEALDEHLKTLSNEGIADFLMNERGGDKIKRADRFYYGDMRLIEMDENEPWSESGWTRMGGFDGFHFDQIGKPAADELLPDAGAS